MNEKNIIKCIRELQDQINILEELDEKEEYVNYSKKQLQEIIDRNKRLKKQYIRRLKDLKWNWILKGNDINTLLN